ncbi:MAG: vitamin K epoxide reductase family protein [Sumerlaeia bacterium]
MPDQQHHPEHEKQSHEQHEHSGGMQSGGMGMRGVSRPMPLHQHHQKHEESHGKESQGHEGHQGHGHMSMSPEHREKMLHMHHRQTLWCYWFIVMAGFWTMMAPLTFSYGSGAVDVAGGREVWLSTAGRAAAMTWSDLICGFLLIVLGWRALTPNRPVSMWGACFVGIWMNIAPVLFWAPTAGAYYNATAVGTLVIAVTILIPGMPNMIMYMKMGNPVPRGWSYNPSSWPQRWIMIAAGFAGWMASRYLGAFQLGYIEEIWDPFFGSQSRQVLNSDMSHMWPVSDAAFGAFAYTFECLMGFMGAPSRWRTMPWMVTFFGILVIPLGLVHIALVISQPVVVGAWCTFCLLAAAIMLPMIPLEVDEVIAMGQHVKQRTRAGEGFWRVFWKGGDPDGSEPDERTPPLADFPKRPMALLKAGFWGMSAPWNLTVSAIVGVGLLFVPWLLGLEKPASAIFHLGGSLAVVFAVIAMGEAVRLTRFLNVLVGLVLAIGPWLTNGGVAAGVIGLLAGVALIGLSLRKGPVRERFGSWDRWVK